MAIELIMGPNGKKIPAQRIRTIYRRTNELFEANTLEVVEVGESYVSHFETCPNANEFSRSR